MPEISIILPSLRPEAVLKRIEESAITNGNLDCEIIVLSPFVIKQDRVVHIYEKEPLGNVLAHHIAYENFSGKYIVYWSDDVYPTANCLANMLRFVKSKREPFIGSFRLRRGGFEKSQWTVYGKLYACLDYLSRNTINLIGGYFEPVYKAHWADPDMCLRVWEKGGRVEVCPEAWVEVYHIVDQVRERSWEKFFAKDKETFFNRWHDKLGRGVARDWRLINRPLYIPPWYYQLVKLSPSFIHAALFNICCSAEKWRRALFSKLSLILG